MIRRWLPKPAKVGRKPIDRRWILNAILYINRTGCQWRAWPEWVKETFGWILQTVLRPVEAKGFVVLPKRWIVERTFAWLARCRRHSRDSFSDDVQLLSESTM